MDFEGDEAGGEADGKAAADLGGADRCGAGTASGCEADGEARGAGGGELGEAGREVGGANDGSTARTLTAMRRAARQMQWW